MENEFKCTDCGDGRWPTPDKRECYVLEVKKIRWDSLLALVPVCVACVGIVLTLAVIIIFMRNSETPIVKVRRVSHQLFLIVIRIKICDRPANVHVFVCFCLVNMIITINQSNDV